MNATAGVPPRHSRSVGFARVFLTGGVLGAAPTALIGGCVVGEPALIVAGVGLPVFYGLLLLFVSLPRRRREADTAPLTALAVVESREPAKAETTEVPVRFELSVVPEDAAAFRVVVRQDVHVSELSDYRPRGVVVVAFPPDRPWKARIVRRPTPEWEERVAGARLDSVPGPALASGHSGGAGGGFLTLAGLLLGAASVLLLFRTELFGTGGSASPPAPRPTVSAEASTDASGSATVTVTVTSATGTVELGPGMSVLDPGRLRSAVESLTRRESQRKALTVIVQEDRITIVYAPDGMRAAGFDPRSLPYGRIPGLVEEARAGTVGRGAGAGTGTGSPSRLPTWQLIAQGAAGVLKLVVTDGSGTGVLEADGQGKVTARAGR
ncbi:hypothetical protein [Streptomyces sp. NPDC097619]|uniref:hypothetical protein n=1 Tax=Streptomyces sp. NPDC097619 TaxID=3157228 RepID=UPI003320D650